MKKVFATMAAAVALFAFTVLPSLALDPPKISLERIEVATIQPFFVKPKLTRPSKADPKKKEEFTGTYGYSSTMNVAYILNIMNPNKEPVMLDELWFTVKFEGFEINTVKYLEDFWIPGGKTNQLRVIGTNEAFPTLVSLMVGADNVERVKKKGTSAGALVGKWFKTIADFSFPIELSNGTAVFVDEKGKEIRTTFGGKFGKAAKEEKAPAGSGKKAPAGSAKKK